MNLSVKCFDDIRPGEIVFLAERLDTTMAKSELRARQEPYRKNLSQEKTLRGWCGETNNISVSSSGCGRVVRALKTREDHYLIQTLADNDPDTVVICRHFEMEVTP